jgi:riboflavin synthase
MFTGIIENKATVKEIIVEGTNLNIWLCSKLAQELKVDQSLAHNGICLTVVAINEDSYCVTAVAETVSKTNVGEWKAGDSINLERALLLGSRLDGHFVQGHVDTVGICTEKQVLDGSYLFSFSFPETFSALVIEKGSVCINGVSLTLYNVGKHEFTVTIIPYTYEHTNFGQLQAGHKVNIEFDVLGKYLLRQQELH